MINHHKIGLIIVYYGNWPDWIPFFLKSCSGNKSIHWLIFSNHIPPGDIPENVVYHPLTLRELVQIIMDTIQIKPAIIHPYKFTDFKPAYGHIFQEYLRDYSHWGYSDLDLVYGSINTFIDDRMLDDHDIISPSPDFFPGHFLLMKNNTQMTTLYQNAVNWKEILTSEKYHCFDEHLLSKGVWPDSKSIVRQVRKKTRNHIAEYKVFRNPVSRIIRKMMPFNDRLSASREIKDFNQAIRNKSLSGEIKAYRKLLFRDDIIHRIKGERDIHITWEKGKLLDDEEIMYYHFQLGKYEKSFRFSSEGPDSFCLTVKLSH
jgi:hypothetical protein